jgi:WD40 repeat protein
MSPSHLDREHPWPALLAYMEEDHDLFGGRDDEADAVFRAIRRDHLTVLYGASGLGKTSLLGAGVFPLLRAANYFPVLIRLDYGIATSLVEQVKQEIRKQADRHSIEVPSATPGTLWQYLHLRDNDFWGVRNRLKMPVLVFDQFEEIFTKGGIDTPAVDELLDDLTDLVSGVSQERLAATESEGQAAVSAYRLHEHRYRLVFALRDDFFPKLETLSERFRGIFTNRVPLTPMSGTAALKSVLRAGGHLVDRETARRLIHVVAGQPDPGDAGPELDDEATQKELEKLVIDPALLSVFFAGLNETRRENKASSIVAPASASSRDEILRRFYNKCFEGLDVAVRDFVERRMVSDGQTRDMISYDRALSEEHISEAAIETLVARRLLRIEESHGVRRIELSHDVLIPIVSASRTERQRDRLLAEQRLARAEAEKSERAARKELRQARLVAAAMFGLFLAAIVGPAWGCFKARSANRRRAITAYTTALQGLESGHSGLALAYLGHALRLNPEHAAARAALADLLVNRKWPLEVKQFTTTNSSVLDVARDGSRILRADGDHLEVDDSGGRSLWSRPFPPDSKAFFNTSDNAVLVTSFDLKTLAAYDALTGEVIQPPTHYEDILFSDMTPDGKTLLLLHASDLLLYPTAKGTKSSPPTHRHYGTGPDLGRFQGGSVSVLGQFYVVTSDLYPKGITSENGRIYDLVKDVEPIPVDVAGEQRSYSRYSAKDTFLLVGTTNHLYVIDAFTGKPTSKPMTLDGSITTADIAPDGRSIVIVTGGNRARIWDAVSGQSVGEPMQHGRNIVSVAFSADGRRIVTASTDGTARCWDGKNGLPIGEPMQHEGPLLSARFAGNDQVLTIDEQNTVHKWRIAGSADSILIDDRPTHFETTADGRTAFVETRKKITAWDLQAGKSIAEKSANDLRTFAVDRAHGRALIFDDDSFVIWNPNVGSITLDVDGPTRSARFSGNGRVAVVHASSLQIFDGATGQRLGQIAAARRAYYEVNASGDRIAVFDGTFLRLFDNSGQLVGVPIPLRKGPGEERAHPFVFSDDGKYLLTFGVTQGVRQFNAQTGASIRGPFEIKEDVRYATLGHNNEWLAIVAARKTIVYDVALTNRPLANPIECGSENRSARFMGDHLLLIGQNSARLWNPAKAEALTESFSFALQPQVVGQLIYYIVGRTVSRIDTAPVNDEEIPMLIELAEDVAGISVSNEGVMAGVFDPSRLRKLAQRCADGRSRTCRAAALFARISSDGTVTSH